MEPETVTEKCGWVDDSGDETCELDARVHIVGTADGEPFDMVFCVAHAAELNANPWPNMEVTEAEVFGDG